MGSKRYARAIAATIHRYVNNKRRANGCDELNGNAQLASIAESYAQTMAHHGYAGHEVGGSTPQRRAARFAGVSENCFEIRHASGRSPQSVASQAVNRWMQSPKHRKNILRDSSSISGVGVWLKDGDAYIAHKFARRRRLIQLGVEAARKIA